MQVLLTGYTVFVTYLLVPDTLTNLIAQEEEEAPLYNNKNMPIPSPPDITLGAGNSKYIHCNYINKLVLATENPRIQEIVISFPYESDFKFLSSDANNGTGYTANKIYALVQLVRNSDFQKMSDVKPNSSLWKKYNITSQIESYTLGDNLTPAMLTGQVFKIPLNNYNAYPLYKLNDYITYPSKLSSANNELCFGDEFFFFGNVRTEIKAVAYTTKISINLNANEFNSSTNETWSSDDKVIISEIGIYDDEYNLVAIGKLNNPIPKDSYTSRTISFDIDF